MQRPLAFVADVLAAVLIAVIIAIVATGGGVFEVAGQRISVMGVDNPLLALTLIVTLRYAFLRRVPIAGRERWSVPVIETQARDSILYLHRRFERREPRDRVAGVLTVALFAAVVKILLAWTYPGFFSGDDVEVHEMSIGALWHVPWPIWDLRNALFPLGVVYPAQKLSALASLDDPASLVVAGRVTVALVSSLTVVLVWRAGLYLWPRTPGYAVFAAVLFATSHLHIAFGSSELPRPVATVLVTGAFVLLLRPGWGRVAAAGALLGLAASLRFSEAIFAVPAMAGLAWQRRWTFAVVVALWAAATAAAAVALSDALYWGAPFHSVRAAVDYTLVQRLSSRGYQSVVWYLLHLFEWVSPGVAILAAVALFRMARVSDVWIWIPLTFLSALPHKEARYMIPVVPFVCLAATRGFQVVAAAIADGPARRRGLPLGVIAVVVIGFAHDAGHWRLPRSNADVAFARQLDAALPRDATVVVEQVWRMGGRLYLHPRQVIDLDPDRLGDAEYLARSVAAGGVVALDSRTVARHGLESALQARGYRVAPLVVAGSRYRYFTPLGSH